MHCTPDHVLQNGQCNCPPDTFGDQCQLSSSCNLEKDISVTLDETAEYQIICNTQDDSKTYYILSCLDDESCTEIQVVGSQAPIEVKVQVNSSSVAHHSSRVLAVDDFAH